jgi:tetratricopeptide (TPR) repeat protein
MKIIVRLLIVITCGVCCSTGWSAENATQRQEAEQLFEAGNYLDALPVYESLAAADPTSAAYAERLAYCLMVKFEILSDGPERTAAYERAKREAERAKSLGDDSNILHVILERMNQPIGVPLEATMQAAEAAFSRGDLERALAGYQEIAARDPASYEARLYSGDVYFRMNKLAAAGEWFQKAIAINPNIETAYRYWGDAFMQGGQAEAAMHKFIDAVIAEPYTRRSWMGLQQWAGKTGHELAHPRIDIPAAPTSKATDLATKDVAIDVNLDKEKDPAIIAIWLAYSAHRAVWRTEEFAKKFPDEKQYRHSLAEEAGAFLMMLAVMDESKLAGDQKNESLRNVTALGKDQMLEPYVLISAADEGIAQDYAAYRDAHRDVLHAYIEKYVVREKKESGD